MASSILAPFQKFAAEGATVGRLLAGYSNIEVGLLHCTVAARGGDLDTILKKMFRIRDETRRINEAEKLALGEYQQLKLATDFQKAISIVRYCLKIRNQYAHWVWWDDHSGRLAFANLEELAARKRPVKDLGKLKPHHVDAALLAAQEAYFVYADRLLAWVNYESRAREGRLKGGNPLIKPKPVRKPKTPAVKILVNLRPLKLECRRAKSAPAICPSISVPFQRAATADGNHSAAIAAVVTKAKLAGLWIERKENKNTNFNTQVIDRRDVPITELSDEELLAIAAGASPEREEMKVLLLPPAPKCQT
jgi:hypothetical protein